MNEVAMVPPPQDSRALTREPIDSGLPRARDRLPLVASAARLVEGTIRATCRSSGRFDALWGAHSR